MASRPGLPKPKSLRTWIRWQAVGHARLVRRRNASPNVMEFSTSSSSGSSRLHSPIAVRSHEARRLTCRRTSRKYNKSLDCLVAQRQGVLAGELIAVTERSLDNAGNLRSFLPGNDGVKRFSVKRTDDFDVTNCTVLPPSDLLLLERLITCACVASRCAFVACRSQVSRKAR